MNILDTQLAGALDGSALVDIIIMECEASFFIPMGGYQNEAGVSWVTTVAGLTTLFSEEYAMVPYLKNLLDLLCYPIEGPVEVPVSSEML